MVCCMFKEINGLLIVSNRQIIEFKNKFTILFVIVQVIIDMQISEEYNCANPIDNLRFAFQNPIQFFYSHLYFFFDDYDYNSHFNNIANI